MTSDRFILAMTGLRAEARIATAPGVIALSGGGSVQRLTAMLETTVAQGASAVISFGIAGGLAAGLAPGATILGRAILDGQRRFDTDPAWTRSLAATLPGAIVADIVGADAALSGAAAKRTLHLATGAAAIDMESHVAARFAAHRGLPFAALRIVADPAERSLPRAAMVGMRPDGSTDALAVLRALTRAPGELPALLHVAFDAHAAFAMLRHSRRSLTARFGFDDVDTEPDQPGGGRLFMTPNV